MSTDFSFTNVHPAGEAISSFSMRQWPAGPSWNEI